MSEQYKFESLIGESFKWTLFCYPFLTGRLFLYLRVLYYEYFEKSIHQEGSASINKIDEEAVCMNTNEDKHVQNAQKQKSGAACKATGKHRTI